MVLPGPWLRLNIRLGKARAAPATCAACGTSGGVGFYEARAPAAGSAEKASRELLEPLVPVGLRALEDPSDVRVKPRLSPVVARRFFRDGSLARPRRLEQSRGRRGIKTRIVSRGQAVVSPRANAARVLVHESA
jgi:hypothetical protein